MKYHDIIKCGEHIKGKDPKWKTSNKESFEKKTFIPLILQVIFYIMVMASGFLVGLALITGITLYGGG